jgi:GNAT superfamily N-acetyltransferase
LTTARAIAIRPAGTGDAEAVASLLAQLGYPQTVELVGERLDELSALDSARVLVATNGDDVVGVGALHVLPVLHEQPKLGRVTALVVARRCRGRGVGQALMDALETMAREAGCGRIEVTSNLRREGAHAFYERLGYEETSKRFVKPL